MLPNLLHEGKLVPNTPDLIEGGLSGIPHGFQAFRDGKVSGKKVIYRLS
jgi:hypothetical protein